MILRVNIDTVNATCDLGDAAWTPELLATLLRHLGDEVLRMCGGLDAVIDDAIEGDPPEGPSAEHA